MNEEKQIKVINKFLEEKIQYYINYVKVLNTKDKTDFEVLDKLFRGTLNELCKEIFYNIKYEERLDL